MPFGEKSCLAGDPISAHNSQHRYHRQMFDLRTSLFDWKSTTAGRKTFFSGGVDRASELDSRFVQFGGGVPKITLGQLTIGGVVGHFHFSTGVLAWSE